jgi:hypothetical protein
MAEVDVTEGRDRQVDEQLRRLEDRLVQETDQVSPDVLHGWIEAVRARFVAARVQTFVPIFVEREVRTRLRSRGA